MRQRRQGDDDITSSHTEPESPVVVSDNELPNLATDATDEAREKVRMNFSVRVVYTFYWLFGYFGIVWAGHFYLAIMVHVLAVLMFREILSLKRSVEKDKTLPLYFSLRWYFYVLTVCGANHRYLLALLSALERLWSGAAVFRPCVEWIEIHFSMVIFILYLLGFVAFILTLRRFSLRYQMQQFGILILTLLFVVCPTATFVGLIYTGIYWFFVASGCVITNDIFAYLFGINFGRTRLLLISPKKTVEGFIGASLVTPIFALGVGSLLTMFPHFVCPANEIELVPFQFQSTCELHPVFQWQQFHLGLSYLRPSWVNDMPCKVLFLVSYSPQRGVLVLGDAHTFPSRRAITVRFHIRPLWWVFRFSVQARDPCKGFRRQHSWTWWDCRPIRLSADHDYFHVHLRENVS